MNAAQSAPHSLILSERLKPSATIVARDIFLLSHAGQSPY